MIVGLDNWKGRAIYGIYNPWWGKTVLKPTEIQPDITTKVFDNINSPLEAIEYETNPCKFIY